MAKPRIFISSTYYDLKHIRASLDNFIEALGFESILSEKGDIAYSPDQPLDHSCYREVSNVDIFVLIIGGRYGSEASSEEKKPSHDFFERYESITKKEYEEAVRNDIPSYILIETNVYAEFRTYLKNKAKKDINYAHVDSVNIFNFIEEIVAKKRNNPIKSFDKFSEIEYWLKEQWAGLFKDLLQRLSNQSQLTSLSSKVEELGEINNTLKTYLESLMTTLNPDTSNELIERESRRLEQKYILQLLQKNALSEFILRNFDMTEDHLIKIIKQITSFDEFIDELKNCVPNPEDNIDFESIVQQKSSAIQDLNQLRGILNLKLV
ncbi:MAG: DUF4062 domain-containing protein [Calditrichaeota bacterium]|nr:MAG: DUF4062 domain-containing protein [Calditrichota bacterium]